MECRQGCGMCCIAPSIVQPLPNMPNGKVAGVACANLDLTSYRCVLWETAQYPDFCRGYLAEVDFCGNSQQEASQILTLLEASTHPDKR